MRLNKIEYGFYLALASRARSEDRQTQTGCVLFDENWRTIGTGFNGFAPKFVPTEDVFEDRSFKSEIICHAEINAILNSSKNAKYLFSVLSPCVSCAKTIAATSIKEVYFIKQYHKAGAEADMKYAKIFDLYGIKVFQISKDSLSNIEKVMKQEVENIKNLSLDLEY
jgi:deoxycytidylate deaminase